MDEDHGAAEQRASRAALAFGSLIRGRRKALKMRQDLLALVAGVGRRFLTLDDIVAETRKIYSGPLRPPRSPT
jgi:hypothetical protein